MAARKPVTTSDDSFTGATSEVVTSGYVKVASPSGAKTIVPASLLEALIESGYSKVK